MEDAMQAYEGVNVQLRGLPLPALLQVATELKVKTKEGDSQLRVLRRITNYLSSEEVQDMDDEGLQILNNLSAFLTTIASTEADSAAETVATPLAPEPTNPTATATASLVNLIKREFKVAGQIGEPGQKDRLTFSSLANQIEIAHQKGYPDQDIIQGVIRAIVPGLPLRSYLEGRSKISLDSLRRIVHSHYQERDATDLYKQLSQLTQEVKESPQSFLLRAFDLRQKVLFASQETDSRLQYDPKLVQEMFRHSIITGLRSDGIKTELKPYLDDPKTPDEVLFEKINVQSSLEAERRRKLNTTRSAAVSEVTEKDRSQQSQPKPGLLLTEIAELKAGIAELTSLKTQVAVLQDSFNKSSRSAPLDKRSARPRRGCPTCQADGTGSTCDHCFKCGSSDHFAVGCRKGRVSTQQGNEARLRPRDGE